MTAAGRGRWPEELAAKVPLAVDTGARPYYFFPALTARDELTKQFEISHPGTFKSPGERRSRRQSRRAPALARMRLV